MCGVLKRTLLPVRLQMYNKIAEIHNLTAQPSGCLYLLFANESNFSISKNHSLVFKQLLCSDLEQLYMIEAVIYWL